jgi:tetratricopeptide (TPR) repeat protein
MNDQSQITKPRRSLLTIKRCLVPVVLLPLALGCHSALDDRPNMVASLNREEPARTEPELPISQAAQACFVTAEDLAASGHDDEAIQLYDRARQYNPKLTQCSHRMALCYERSGKYAEALAEYQKAMKSSPKDAALLNDVGYFYLQRGNLDEAEKSLRAAVASDAKCLPAWANLGLVLGYRQRYGEAYEALAKAATPAEAHSNLGVILAQQEKFAAARAEFQQALSLNAELQQPRRLLAWLDQRSQATVAQQMALPKMALPTDASVTR